MKIDFLKQIKSSNFNKERFEIFVDQYNINTSNIRSELLRIYEELYLKNTKELVQYVTQVFLKKGLSNTSLLGYNDLLKMTTEKYDSEHHDAIPQELVVAWINDNVNLITDVTNAIKTNVKMIMNTYYRIGMSQETLSELIAKELRLNGNTFETSVRRANLIATDQINKLRGKIDQYNQTEILKNDQYEWMTMRDEKVRKTHKPMDGKMCLWSDSSVYLVDGKKYKRSSIGGVDKSPGEDINCRCIAVPIL
jgi:SPP1 gp7 family putative phage head morphogenesis protein